MARPLSVSKKWRFWVSTTRSTFWPGRTWLRALTRAVHSDLSPMRGSTAASSSSPVSWAATVSLCSTGGASMRNRTLISLPSSSVTSARVGMWAQPVELPLAAEASSKSEGRMPRISFLPKYWSRPGFSAKVDSGTGSLRPANDTAAPESPRTSSALTKFIDGEPMKPATNRLTGLSKRFCGVSTCWRMPSRSTQTRSPRVMASTWSCVT